MKEKELSRDKEHEINGKNDHFTLSYLAQEKDFPVIYSISYSYPFMPMIDLRFVYDECIQMFKKWLGTKKKDINHL